MIEKNVLSVSNLQYYKYSSAVNDTFLLFIIICMYTTLIVINNNDYDYYNIITFSLVNAFGCCNNALFDIIITVVLIIHL